MINDSETRFCKDCKYFQGYNNSWCKHPNNGLDLVDGSIKPMFCAVARGSISGMCKPEGLLFEPKEEEEVFQEISSIKKLVKWFKESL